jgi:hypothetical protein
MTRKLVPLFSILVGLAIGLAAADISGKWEAQVPGRGGEARTAVFTFKVDGEKLTGTMDGGRGEPATLEDGKVSGNTVTFSVTTQRGKRTYTGTISGTEIKFKREGGQAAQEFTAKRPVT